MQEKYTTIITVIIYVVSFICTMITVFIGERKTSVSQPRDYQEFEGRIITAALAVIFFIIISATLDHIWIWLLKALKLI